MSFLMALLIYAVDYSEVHEKNFTNDWKTSLNYGGRKRIDGTYTITTSGSLWWKKNHYNLTTIGYPLKSTAYVSSTLWVGNDYDFKSSNIITEGICKATYTVDDTRPTKAQLYLRDGGSVDADFYYITVRQS